MRASSLADFFADKVHTFVTIFFDNDDFICGKVTDVGLDHVELIHFPGDEENEQGYWMCCPYSAIRRVEDPKAVRRKSMKEFS